MPATTDQILQILDDYGIDSPGFDERIEGITGNIDEGEDLYEVSVDDLLGPKPERGFVDDRNDFGVQDENAIKALDQYLREMRGEGWAGRAGRTDGVDPLVFDTSRPPEPICSWYSPIHYFGRDWGIYIREECVIGQAFAIATHVRGRLNGRAAWGSPKH